MPFDRDVLSRALEFLDYDEPLPGVHRTPRFRSLEPEATAEWPDRRHRLGVDGPSSLPCQDIFRYFYIQDALFHGPGNAWDVL